MTRAYLTPANDTDVQLNDLNLDGWLDVVTATTLSDGEAKCISHPRIYIHKGRIGAVWQGLKYGEACIPQLISLQGLPVAPRFTSVLVGDVDANGAPDLCFTDMDDTETGYAEPAAWDLDERLLM